MKRKLLTWHSNSDYGKGSERQSEAYKKVHLQCENYTKKTR